MRTYGFLYVLMCFFVVGFLVPDGAISSSSKSDPLKIKMSGYVVVVEKVKGKSVERLAPLGKNVDPGALVQYEITAVNDSSGVLNNISVVGEIPPSMNYVEKSAKSSKKSEALFSADNGDTFSEKPLRTVVSESGSLKKVLASPNEYTNLKFISSKIKPKKKIVYTYRAVVK